MSEIQTFSADSHVIEPPDLWIERIDKEFLERAPRIVSNDVGDNWYMEGTRAGSFEGGINAGRRL